MSNTSSQQISIIQATAMGINIMIGAGVLTGPAIMAMGAGSISFLGWLAAAIILLPIVYNVARLPEAIPGAGGMYLYCKQGLGRFGGFVGGWLYFLCYNFAITVVLSSFRAAFLVLYPDLFILKSKVLFLCICFVGIYAFNMISASTSALIQSSLTYFKLIPIITAIALLPFFWGTANFSINVADFSLLYKALPMAIFGFFGFEYCCNISHMVEGGAAAARKSIIAGFLIVAALYTLFHYSVLNIMGIDGLIAFKASGYSNFIGVKFPLIANVLALILPIATAVTYVNSSNGIMFLDSIILQSLSDDGILRFGKYFSALNPGGRPWLSVLASCLLALFSGSVITSIQQLGNITNLCIFTLLGIATISLLKVDSDNAFGFNKIVGIAGLIICCLMMVFSWTQLATNNYARLLSLAPLFAGLVIGLLLFNPSKPTSFFEKILND